MFASLLLVSILAANPQASISGDKLVFVGQPAKISAAKSNNVKSYVWLVQPEPLYAEKFNQGSQVRISHDEPATFYLTLVVASPDGGVDTATWTLKVEAKAKQIMGSTDSTNFNQRPSLLARQLARELAMEAPVLQFDAIALLDEVESDNIKTEANSVSNALLQEVRFLEGLPDAPPNVKNIVSSTATLCKSSLTKAQWESWAPWFAGLGEYLDELEADGELETLQDYAIVLHEVVGDLKSFSQEKQE